MDSIDIIDRKYYSIHYYTTLCYIILYHAGAEHHTTS